MESSQFLRNRRNQRIPSKFWRNPRNSFEIEGIRGFQKFWWNPRNSLEIEGIRGFQKFWWNPHNSFEIEGIRGFQKFWWNPRNSLGVRESWDSGDPSSRRLPQKWGSSRIPAGRVSSSRPNSISGGRCGEGPSFSRSGGLDRSHPIWSLDEVPQTWVFEPAVSRPLPPAACAVHRVGRSLLYFEISKTCAGMRLPSTSNGKFIARLLLQGFHETDHDKRPVTSFFSRSTSTSPWKHAANGILKNLRLFAL